MKKWIKNFLFEVGPFFFPKYTIIDSKRVGVCTLLCHRDVDMFIWNLTSFFYFIDNGLPVYIVSDGSLTKKDKLKLASHFCVVVESKKTVAKKMQKKISKLWSFKKYRFSNRTMILKRKFDVMLLNPFKKFIYLDADILFWKKPQKIVDWLKDDQGFSFYTAHHSYKATKYGYYDEVGHWAFRRLLFKYLKNTKEPTFNSGMLGVADRKNLDLVRMNKVLSLLGEIEYLKHFLPEETTMAYAWDDKKSRLLPTLEYVNVSGDEEYRSNVSVNSVSVHYSGEIKNFRYKSDALILAWKTRFFRLR